MKKLLLVLMVLMTFKTFSQGKYKLKYYLYLEHSRTRRVCSDDNYMNLFANLKKGTLQLEHIDRGEDFPGIKTKRFKEIKFDADNVIENIQFKSFVNDSNGLCNSGKDTNINLTPLITYPYHRDGNYIFMGSDVMEVTSHFEYEIFPVVEIDFKDGHNRNVCESDAAVIVATKGFEDNGRDVYIWEFEDLLYRDWYDNSDYLKVIKEEDYLNRKKSIYLFYFKKIFLLPWPFGSDEEKIKDLVESKFSNETNIIKEKLARVNKDSFTYGFRRIEGKHKSTVKIKLSDLYPDEKDRAKILKQNKTIKIRVNPKGNGDEETSNILLINFSPNPPELRKENSVVYTPPKCSNEKLKIGEVQFKVAFKRNLLSGEVMNLSLEKDMGGGKYEALNTAPIKANEFKDPGDGFYYYEWKKRKEDADIVSGNYRLIVSGKDNGVVYCKTDSFTTDISISMPEPVKFNPIVVQHETCYNTNDGEINLQATGGAWGYEYSLDKGKTWNELTSPTLKNLAPGKYEILLKEKGCSIIPDDLKIIKIKGKQKITFTIDEEILHPGLPKNSDGFIRLFNIKGGTPEKELYNYRVLKNGDLNNVISKGKVTLNTSDSESINLENLPAGRHTIEFLHSSCSQKEELPELKDPEPLKCTFSSTKTNCFGDMGSITVANINGGYPNYRVMITQEDGNFSKNYVSVLGGISNVTEVPVGKYKVTVTDNRLLASQVKIMTIEGPEKIEITNITATPILCYGEKSTIKLEATGGKTKVYEYALYEKNLKWQESNVFELPSSRTKYSFIARDKSIKNCTSKVFTMEEKTIAPKFPIEADFIASSQVFTDESFVIVSMSSSDNDKVTWLLPDGVDKINVSDDYCELLINEEGEYEVTMVVEKDKCKKIKTKKFIVTKKMLISNKEKQTNKELIKLINLYPNPSSGQFKIDVELNRNSSVNMKLYKLSGILIDELEYSGESEYHLDYDYDLVSGIYFVLIEINGERIMKKIVIR